MRAYIADDNEEFSRFMRRVAENEGWRVTTCTTGRELLVEVALEDDPALIIVDLNMPELDGIEVIDGLKIQRRRMRVRFITGGVESAAVAAKAIAEARGIDAGPFILKPIGVNSLRGILRSEADLLYA